MSDDLDVYEIGFIKHIEILDDTEDVKTVRFEGQQGTTDVRVTDDTMVEVLADSRQRVSGDPYRPSRVERRVRPRRKRRVTSSR